MTGKALTRKLAATAVAAFACGGAAWAAAAALPAGGGSHVHAAADESTTGDLETTTTGDLETTTTGDHETTTTGDHETTTTLDGTTTSAPCNHGHDVSEVAHNTPPGPGHGAAVSEAAHKKCDKGNKGDHESGESDDESGESEGGTHGPPADAGHQGAEHSHGHAHSGDVPDEND